MEQDDNIVSLAKFLSDRIKPELVDLPGSEGMQACLLPDGMSLRSMKALSDEWRGSPERVKAHVRVDDAESMAAYVNRFKRKDLGAIFANQDNFTLVAQLDYHRDGCAGSAQFLDHLVTYRCPKSAEWEAWLGANGARMEQAQFAEFLEDHLPDIVDPGRAGPSVVDYVEQLQTSLATPAKLLELSRGLSVNVGSKVSQHHKLSTGEGEVSFSEEHLDSFGAKLKVPGAFCIGIPVMRNGARYMLAARLRYRVAGGGVVWWYDLHRADAALADAFREAACELAKETDLDLFFGSA